jgi:hypothetical protein
MSIVILNWTGGEKNQFTDFSDCLKSVLQEEGKTVRIIDLGDQCLPELLEEHKTNGIEFAFTWDGLGSRLKSNSSLGSSVWDDLHIPLLCYHRAHPSLNLENHSASSPWIRHIYAAQSYANFANKYFPRKEQALFLELPIIFPKNKIEKFSGDYFVLVRDLEDNVKTYESWSGVPQRNLVEFLGNADEEISAEFMRGNRKDLHDTIDALLTPSAFAKIQQDFVAEQEISIRFIAHNLLHKIYRNMVSEYLVLELADMPLKVYGDGWDRFKAMHNPKHEFLDVRSVPHSAAQFSSNYGILDVADVNDLLNDQTQRALAQSSAFLAGTNWSHQSSLGSDFSDLFFDGAPGNLYSKAEWIIKSPALHREKCQFFAEEHRAHFPTSKYLKQLLMLGESVRDDHNPALAQISILKA